MRLTSPLVVWPAAVAALLAQDCPQDKRPTTAVPPPAWRAFAESGSPATHVRIGNGVETVTPGAKLSAFGAHPFPPSNQGALSASVYPAGPPWVTNNAQRSACPERKAGEDCTGARIPRSPGSYFLSGRLQQAGRGFEFHGRLGGKLAAPPKPGAAVLESVFYHQSPVYLGHPEYGFYYEPAVPRIVFYWSTNSNCGYSPAICQAARGGMDGVLMYENGSGPNGSAPPPLTRTHGCTLPVPGFREYVYQVWIRDGHFRVRVLDPTTRRDVIAPSWIDPNVSGGAWFPIKAVAAASGHLTAGIVRIDPDGALRADTADPPLLTVKALRVAVAPSSIAGPKARAPAKR